jgi:hypothetical protein
VQLHLSQQDDVFPVISKIDSTLSRLGRDLQQQLQRAKSLCANMSYLVLSCGFGKIYYTSKKHEQLQNLVFTKKTTQKSIFT